MWAMSALPRSAARWPATARGGASAIEQHGGCVAIDRRATAPTPRRGDNGGMSPSPSAPWRHPEFRRGAQDMLGISLGISAWGLVTGVAMVKSGLSVPLGVVVDLVRVPRHL